MLLLFLPTLKSISEDKEKQNTTASTTEYTYTYQMPTLDMPLRYFTDNSIAWGSVNTSGDSDDRHTWEYAAVDAGYHSFSTSTITLSQDDFSNEVKELPPTKTLGEILKQDKEKDTPRRWLYEEQINEYGDLATRFLPDTIDVEKFDINEDGKNETVISLCGGGNHCPDSIIIVKDKKIIFSVSTEMTGLKLVKSETGNGFYVEWVPSWVEGGKWDVGLCCPPGYRKTRFVFEDSKFVPVYEQEILYVQVHNKE